MTEIEKMYPDIYKSVFDEVDMYQMPTIVYLGFKDSNLKGFMAGYLMSQITFYLLHTGVVRHDRGYGTLEIFRAGLKEIDKEFPFIMTVVENTNTSAIKLAMNEGFQIHGFRVDTANHKFVELIRRQYGGIT